MYNCFVTEPIKKTKQIFWLADNAALTHIRRIFEYDNCKIFQLASKFGKWLVFDLYSFTDIYKLLNIWIIVNKGITDY